MSTSICVKAEPDHPDTILDLRGTPCPLNFIRAKLKLEQLPLGHQLELWLDGGEPIEQVPNSLRLEGYAVDICEHPQPHFVVRVHRAIEA